MTGEAPEYDEETAEDYNSATEENQDEQDSPDEVENDQSYCDFDDEVNSDDESNEYYDGVVNRFEDKRGRFDKGRPNSGQFNNNRRGFGNRGGFASRQSTGQTAGNGNDSSQQQPKKYPKPGYAMVDGVETMIVDLEKAKRVPCLLDGKNHALSDCNLSTAQRMQIFAEKKICQKCLKRGHLYFKCPDKHLIRSFCTSCKRPGHWYFCCWRTIDEKTEERESGSGAGNITPTVSVNKFIPANALAEAIISRIGNDSACKYQASKKDQ